MEFKKVFKFYIGLQLIYKVMLVPGVQQSDSLIHIHTPVLFQILFLFRLLYNIEQSSLSYMLGLCVCVCVCFLNQTTF